MQLVGAIFIALAFLLLWASKLTKEERKWMCIASFACAVIGALIDVPLYTHKLGTITELIQFYVQRPYAVGVAAALVFTEGVIFGMRHMQHFLMGVITGHLFWS